ncbi:MAG: hypothetical protein ACTSX2_09565 [Candidatus Thorarchaeota archaeon]
MPRRSANPRPNEVLIQSIYTGLSAVARMGSTRARYGNPRLAEAMESLWRRARTRYRRSGTGRTRDFSPIRNAEPNLRRLFLKMVWNSTRRYGNVERKRVYSWREGTVGPLNALLNYAGARLRELAVTQYPFPEPKKYQIREYRDGRQVVLNEHMAGLRGEDDGAVKTYWRAGYPASRTYPRVFLAHPTLPSLDFVDMIRAHVVELVRQCFIHNVPRTIAQAYIDRLIHELAPFLEYVYTGGERGRKDFFPEADRELRNIVLEIRAEYGVRAGRRQRMSRLVREFQTASANIETLRQNALHALKELEDTEAIAQAQEILDQIDRANIGEADVDRLMERVTTLAQHQGTDWHRMLLSGLPHPASLKSVVLHGDGLLDRPSDTLFVAELSVLGEGAGAADIVLFLRRIIDERVVWTPIAVLEIKTKSAFDFTIIGIRPRTKKYDTRVPHPIIERRPLTDSEWERVLHSTPTLSAEHQLDLYSRAIIQEYSDLITNDPRPPGTLWQGVILIDTTQRQRDEAYSQFMELLRGLGEELIAGGPDPSQRTLFAVSGSDSRIAVVVLPSTRQGNAPPPVRENRAGPPPTLPEQDPFAQRRDHKAFFTLYVSVASPTSYGPAATTVATRWHLINHLDELCSGHRPPPTIVWLDFRGVYPTEGHRTLLYRRLGLHSVNVRGGIPRDRLRRLRGLVDHIHFVDIHEAMNAFLREPTGNNLTVLKGHMADILQSYGNGSTVIILDGWSELSRLRPLSNGTLRVLEERLVRWLDGENREVLWLDTGVPDSRMDPVFQKHRVRPLPHDSPRARVLDEIIWNLPLPPRVFGWRAPVAEDARVIVQDLPSASRPWSTVIHVPQLTGWSARFRAATVDRRPVLDMTKAEDQTGQRERPMYGRGVTLSSIQSPFINTEELVEAAMTLLPNLSRSRSHGPGLPAVLEAHGERVELDQRPLPPPSRSIRPPSEKAATTDRYDRLEARLTLRPQIAASLLVERRNYSPPGGITRSWRWKHERAHDANDDVAAESRHKRVTHRPPPIALWNTTLDTEEHRRRELHRLSNTARFLTRRTEILFDEDLVNLLERVRTICAEGLRTGASLDALQQVAHVLLSRKETREVWLLLREERLQSREILSRNNRQLVEQRLRTVPNLFLLYGNALFLLITAIVRRLVDSPRPEAIQTLWRAVGQWVLIHIGLEIDREALGDTVSRYSTHALYSNLRSRLSNLQRLRRPVPETRHHPADDVTEPTMDSPMMISRRILEVRHGRLLILEDETDPTIEPLAWLLFPQTPSSAPPSPSEPWFMGLFRLGSRFLMRGGWARGITDYSHLWTAAERARGVSTSVKVFPAAVVHTSNGRLLLWLKSLVMEDDSLEWHCSGLLEYPRQRQVAQKSIGTLHPLPLHLRLLRWLSLSRPTDIDVAAYQPDDSAVDHEAIDAHVTELLERVMEQTRDVDHVHVRVSLDTVQGVYEVALGESRANPDMYGVYHFSQTRELLSFLRWPMDSGLPVDLAGGQVSWNPIEDIHYRELVLPRGLVPLSLLRPWVERREPLDGITILPEDVMSLLGGVTGLTVQLQFAPVPRNSGPTMHDGRWSCLWQCTDVVVPDEDGVATMNLPEREQLLAGLRELPLSWTKLALLTDAGMVFDPHDGSGYLTDIVVEYSEGVVIPDWVRQHPQLLEALEAAGYPVRALSYDPGASEEPVLTAEEEARLEVEWAEAEEQQWLEAEAREGAQPGDPDFDGVLLDEADDVRIRTLNENGFVFDCWVAGRDGIELHLLGREEETSRVIRTGALLSDLRGRGIHREVLDEVLEQWLRHGGGVELDGDLFATVRDGLEDFLKRQGVHIVYDL